MRGNAGRALLRPMTARRSGCWRRSSAVPRTARATRAPLAGGGEGLSRATKGVRALAPWINRATSWSDGTSRAEPYGEWLVRVTWREVYRRLVLTMRRSDIVRCPRPHGRNPLLPEVVEVGGFELALPEPGVSDLAAAAEVHEVRAEHSLRLFVGDDYLDLTALGRDGA